MFNCEGVFMENCMYINIMFQEEYKKLDKLCKDCFSSVDGVSEYIRQLENEQYSLQKFIISWEDDYKMLKHVRWIRNQLSHEVGALQSDICTQEDLCFVINFYDKIINCTDALAQIRILKENERRIQRTKYNASANETIKQNAPINKNNKQRG